MKVVGCAVDDDGVACIVTAGGARNDLEFVGEDVDEFAFAWWCC